MSERKTDWSLFDLRLCLNQETRPERWEQAKTEFDRVGLDARRFLSIRADQPNKSFCLSQYAMLLDFLHSGKTTLLALEDDAAFRNLEHMAAALNELPADWDIVYLGANITDMVFGITENRPERFSDHLYRVRRAWTSHAIGYSRKAAQKIVQKYPVQSFEMYDCWLSQNFLEHNNCFLINPQLAWQRPGRSDIWNNDTDYTGAFEWGDNFMKNA